MYENLGWIFTIIIGVAIYLIFVAKKKNGEGYKISPEYKYILPILISLVISFFIILIIPDSFFAQRSFDPDNILSVIKSELNNIIAIHLGIAAFLWRYIAVFLKAKDIKEFSIWYAIQAGIGAYVLILFLSSYSRIHEILSRILNSN